MKVRAFSLIEVLTALVIAASLMTLSGSMFRNVLDHRVQSDATRNDIATELALQLLAADIDNSLGQLGLPSAVKIRQLQDRGFEFVFKKYGYAQGILNIQTFNILWRFDGTTITRSLTGGTDPVIIAKGNYDISLNRIDTRAIQLELTTKKRKRSIILWRQGQPI